MYFLNIILYYFLFQRKICWEPGRDGVARRCFEDAGKKRFTDLFSEVRDLGYMSWIGEDNWERLQEHWESEPFKKRQKQGKDARASPKGGSLHCGGSASTATHAAKMVMYQCFLKILL